MGSFVIAWALAAEPDIAGDPAVDPPVSAPPVSGPPVSAPPASVPPVSAPPSDDPPGFEAVDPKRNAWNLARRTRIGGVVMTGAALAAGVGVYLAFPAATRDGVALGLALVGIELGAPLALYGVTCLVLGHVLEDRALAGVSRNALAGKAALVLFAASAGTVGVTIAQAASNEEPLLPYGWIFVGAMTGGLMLEVVQMYDTGRPYGKEPMLSWTVAPTAHGLAVVGRW